MKSVQFQKMSILTPRKVLRFTSPPPLLRISVPVGHQPPSPPEFPIFENTPVKTVNPLLWLSQFQPRAPPPPPGHLSGICRAFVLKKKKIAPWQEPCPWWGQHTYKNPYGGASGRGQIPDPWDKIKILFSDCSKNIFSYR